MEGRNDSEKKIAFKIDVVRSQHIMDAHKINSASISSFKSGNPIETIVLNHSESTSVATEESRYRIASLSKTIFAHLVEVLIEKNKKNEKSDWLGKFELPASVVSFDLDTPLHLILPLKGLDSVDAKKAELITAKMILSHSSGLPGRPNQDPKGLLFNPGEKYSYSNLGFEYLQAIIEKLTRSTLQPLAQTHIFTPLEMTNTSYYPPHQLVPIFSVKSQPSQELKPGHIYLESAHEGLKYQVVDVINNTNVLKEDIIPWENLPTDFSRDMKEIIKNQEKLSPTLLDITAAMSGIPKAIAQNSVHTTPTDFARFSLMMLNTQHQHAAFTKSNVSMTSDRWAVEQGIAEETLNHISWGNGWALQLDVNGNPEKAFHYGDYGHAGLDWRALVVLDLKNKEGIIFMSDSRNGLLLADQVVNERTVSLPQGLDFIFDKFGFAREKDLSHSDLPSLENDRVSKIIALREENMLITVDEASRCMSVKCNPILAGWMSQDVTEGIKKVLDVFVLEKQIGQNDFDALIEKDKNDNILSLSIKFKDQDTYNQFISQLNKNKLLIGIAPAFELKQNQKSVEPAPSSSERKNTQEKYEAIKQKAFPESIDNLSKQQRPDSSENISESTPATRLKK